MKSFKTFNDDLKYHIRPDENGHIVPLSKPSKSSPTEHWENPNKIATISVGDDLIDKRFSSWHGVHDWSAVDGQGNFDEPPMKETNKRIATGAIVHEDDGRVWVVHPSNGFGGYRATFPKGGLDKGLSHRANAIKEVYEESGLKIALTGHAYDIERSTSMTRFYHAKRVGGHPKDMGWESQAVSLVPKDKLKHVLNNKYDHEVVDKVFGS